MKLSMWLIADGLSHHRLEIKIQSGQQIINGIRLFSEEVSSFEDPCVYIGNASLGIDDAKYHNVVMLLHHHDMILVYDTNLDIIINEVLALFDRFNAWESAMREAAMSDDAFHRILALSKPFLSGPAYLVDEFGGITAHADFDISPGEDPLWDDICANKNLPLYASSSPIIDTTGSKQYTYKNTPDIYYLDTGKKMICVLIYKGHEPVLALAMHEYRKPIQPQDLQIIGAITDVINTAIQNSHLEGVLSGNALLEGLIQGQVYEEKLFSNLLSNRGIRKPWRITAIQNIAMNNTQKINMMLSTISRFSLSTIGTIHDGKVVVLLQDQDCDSFLREMDLNLLRSNLCFGISLPFYELEDAKVYYEQALFAVEQANGTAGVFRLEDYSGKRLLHILKERSRQTGLLHPALAFLRAYDKNHKTELYQTLKAYLYNERNALKTATVLGIHRNTMMNRLDKITQVLPDLDLENEAVRIYLLASFVLA